MAYTAVVTGMACDLAATQLSQYILTANAVMCGRVVYMHIDFRIC